MKIDAPTKPKNWPFRWVNGKDTAENCRLKLVKRSKSRQYEAISDMEEALF
jgi:hypothetical protein